MSIAEKLLQIAEKQLKVYEAGKKSVEPGGDQPSYETIVFAQDCTNAQQVKNILYPTLSSEDKIVIFINKAWVNPPDGNTVNNQGLWMMLFSNEYNLPGAFGRWRDGGHSSYNTINASMDYIVSVGEEWLKVVLL